MDSHTGLFDPMSKHLHNADIKAGLSTDRSKAVCFAFQKGYCARGSSCKFIHNLPKPIDQPEPIPISPQLKEKSTTSMKSIRSSDTLSISSSSSSSVTTSKRHKKSKKSKKRGLGGKDKKEKRKKSDKKRKRDTDALDDNSKCKSKRLKNECPICFEIKMLTCILGDCKHALCQDCGDRWSNGCPVCRGFKKVDLERNVLRLKRLERERLERKRTSIVLAKADIFGNSISGNGNEVSDTGFNQQFNPSLSKRRS